MNKITKKYKCPWPGCGKEFEQIVGKYTGFKNNVSSQVQCPDCKNFIKTWDEPTVSNKVLRKMLKHKRLGARNGTV